MWNRRTAWRCHGTTEFTLNARQFVLASATMTKANFQSWLLWGVTAGVLALGSLSVRYILLADSQDVELSMVRADLAACQAQLPPFPAVSK